MNWILSDEFWSDVVSVTKRQRKNLANKYLIPKDWDRAFFGVIRREGSTLK